MFAKWKLLSIENTPSNLDGHKTCVYKDKAYIYGVSTGEISKTARETYKFVNIEEDEEEEDKEDDEYDKYSDIKEPHFYELDLKELKTIKRVNGEKNMVGLEDPVCVVCSDRLIIHGGSHRNDECCNAIFSFSFKDSSFKKEMNEKNGIGHNGVLYKNQYLYYFGGYHPYDIYESETGQPSWQHLFKLNLDDFESDNLETEGDIPFQKFRNFQMEIVDDTIYLFHCEGLMYEYNIITNQWKTYPIDLKLFNGTMTKISNNSLFITGGDIYTKPPSFNSWSHKYKINESSFIYNINSHQLYKIENVGDYKALKFHNIIEYHSKYYVFFGYDINGYRSQDIFEIQILQSLKFKDLDRDLYFHFK